MIEKIKAYFRQFMDDLRAASRVLRQLVTAAGIVGSLTLAFTGHIFTAVAIGGLTYFFWRNGRGEDEFVGTARTN